MPRGPACGCGQHVSLITSQCVEASGYYDYAHSDPTVAATVTTLKESNQAYNAATGLNTGETTRPRRVPLPASCLSLERLPPPSQGNGALAWQGVEGTTLTNR